MTAETSEGSERQQPNIRESYDGITFRTLMPGITTHPLIRSGRPCIKGTTIEVKTIAGLQKFHNLDAQGIADHLWIELSMVKAALNYYASHKQYIDVSMQLSSINHDQFAESHNGTRSESIHSRRKRVA